MDIHSLFISPPCCSQYFFHKIYVDNYSKKYLVVSFNPKKSKFPKYIVSPSWARPLGTLGFAPRWSGAQSHILADLGCEELKSKYPVPL